MAWLTIIMAGIYIILGCILIFTRIYQEYIQQHRTAMGIVFLLYGSFRLYSGYTKWKKLRLNKNHD